MNYSNLHIVIALTCAILLSCRATTAQVIDHWGLKAGVSLAKQTEVDYGNDNQLKSRAGADLGLFFEWSENSWFSINSEVEFVQKGRELDIPFTTEQFPNGTGQFSKESIRLNYISLVALAKAYIDLSAFEAYGSVGPRVDLLLSNSADVQAPEAYQANILNRLQYELKYYKSAQLGSTLAVGFQTHSLLPFSSGVEVRYSPDFTHALEYPDVYTNQSWEFLLVFTF